MIGKKVWKTKKPDTFASDLSFDDGGAEEARTLYLLLAKQALSQVSYSPTSKAYLL